MPVPSASSGHRDLLLSWEEAHRDSKTLAGMLREKGPWSGIVAITRGGLVPACILARKLEIFRIETLCISSYDHQDRREAEVLKKVEISNGGKGWIVVDDLVDTGATFKVARELLPGAHFACVYAKPEGKTFTDTFVSEVGQGTWIHFPWEETYPG